MGITEYDMRLSGTRGHEPVALIACAFTTDGDGDASEESETLNGRVSRIVTNPDDTATPTTNWDLTILDEDGIDILGGSGADRDAADSGASEQVAPSVAELAVASTLTFTVAHGGSAKKGVVNLYME